PPRRRDHGRHSTLHRPDAGDSDQRSRRRLIGNQALFLVARFGFVFAPEELSATAARTSALNALASTCSPSGMSIARRTFPSRLELKSLAGSFNEAPLAKVSFTIDL